MNARGNGAALISLHEQTIQDEVH